jgi:hypothetical protein
VCWTAVSNRIEWTVEDSSFSEINFGMVMFGTSASLTLRARNDGQAPKDLLLRVAEHNFPPNLSPSQQAFLLSKSIFEYPPSLTLRPRQTHALKLTLHAPLPATQAEKAQVSEKYVLLVEGAAKLAFPIKVHFLELGLEIKEEENELRVRETTTLMPVPFTLVFSGIQVGCPDRLLKKVYDPRAKNYKINIVLQEQQQVKFQLERGH